MIRLLIALFLLSGAASAQSVQQSGVVTPGHVPTWVTTGVIQDGGTPGSPQITGGIGVANSNQRSICTQNSKTGAVSQLCLGSTPTGTFLTSSTLTGPPQPFTIQINGANFPIPTALLPFPGLDGRSFGIKADGVTSDDVALKAAIDACAAGGLFLWLPPGQILLTGAGSTTSTLQNCHIQGTAVPGGKTSVASQGTMILLTSTTVKPFLAGNNWSWSGTNFFWPNQTSGTTVYPALLNMDIDSCNWWFNENIVANAYDFLADSGAHCQGAWHINDNIIYAVHNAISSTGQGDTIFVSRNQFSPGPWLNLDPVNAPTGLNAAALVNTVFHVENVGTKAWNIIAMDDAMFAWRYAIRLDATAVVGLSDFSFVTDQVGTLIDTSSGGNWAAGNGFQVNGNCAVLNLAVGPAPACLKLGAGSNVEIKNSTIAATGSFVENAGSNVTIQDMTTSSIGTFNDGSEYYGILSTVGGGTQIIVQNSTMQGNQLSNKAHVHGIHSTVAPSRLIVQNNRLLFFQEEIDVQSAATSIITGNWSVGTNGASSVLISGSTGVQFANNEFDKLDNSVLSACGGATVASGTFSGFFTVGATNPTTSCSLTFPFALFGAGGGACQFQQSSNLILWANASGSPATWVVSSSADMHAQIIFFNCRATQ